MTRDVLEQEDREPESQDQVQFTSKTISKPNKNMLLWNFWIFGPHFWMHRAQSTECIYSATTIANNIVSESSLDLFL